MAGCLAQTVEQSAATTAAKPAAKRAPTTAAKPQPGQTGDEPAEGNDVGQGKAAQKPKKRDPAEAQRSIDNGVKLLQAGKVEPAISTFSAVISGGNLPPPVMAKALFNRGLAFRKSGKPAQAISDLQSALWLKGGLVETERAEALQARIEAYREAGLPDQSNGVGDGAGAPASTAARRAKSQADEAGGKASTAAAATAVATAPTQPTQASRALIAPVTPSAPPAPPASGGGNFFSTLFGGGSSAPAQAATQPTPAPPPAPPKADVGQAWSSITSVKTPRAPAKEGPSQVAAATPPAAASPAARSAATKPDTGGGRFRAQVALVRSAGEAQAVVAKLKKDYAAALAQREPSVDQATLGNMGAFYRVRIGPYNSQAEAQGVCSGLKGSGLDCVAVTQ